MQKSSPTSFSSEKVFNFFSVFCSHILCIHSFLQHQFYSLHLAVCSHHCLQRKFPCGIKHDRLFSSKANVQFIRYFSTRKRIVLQDVPVQKCLQQHVINLLVLSMRRASSEKSYSSTKSDTIIDDPRDLQNIGLIISPKEKLITVRIVRALVMHNSNYWSISFRKDTVFLSSSANFVKNSFLYRPFAIMTVKVHALLMVKVTETKVVEPVLLQTFCPYVVWIQSANTATIRLSICIASKN